MELVNTSLEAQTQKLVRLLLPVLGQVIERKNERYRSSWCKYGEAVSVFGNVARKFDRLEAEVVYHQKASGDESKVDGVGDLANYAILWLTWIIRNQPESVLDWLNTTAQLIGETEEYKALFRVVEDYRASVARLPRMPGGISSEGTRGKP